jgi:hypothetical protein
MVDRNDVNQVLAVRDCQEYLSWLCAMMHEMHHSVLLAQWSAEVRHTLTLAVIDELPTLILIELPQFVYGTFPDRKVSRIT